MLHAKTVHNPDIVERRNSTQACWSSQLTRPPIHCNNIVKKTKLECLYYVEIFRYFEKCSQVFFCCFRCRSWSSRCRRDQQSWGPQSSAWRTWRRTWWRSACQMRTTDLRSVLLSKFCPAAPLWPTTCFSSSDQRHSWINYSNWWF